MRDKNGQICQIQEISSNQNNINQNLRIELSWRREEEDDDPRNNNINNPINIK